MAAENISASNDPFANEVNSISPWNGCAVKSKLNSPGVVDNKPETLDEMNEFAEVKTTTFVPSFRVRFQPVIIDEPRPRPRLPSVVIVPVRDPKEEQLGKHCWD